MTTSALPLTPEMAERLGGTPLLLLLSRFTGSAEEIDGAVLINPFNIDGFVSAIRTALEMSPEERRRRMHRMRRQLHNSTIFDWLDSILSRATEIMSVQQSRAQAAAV